MVSITCKADSADSCGGIVEGYGPVASCEDGFEFISQRKGAGDVPSIVNMHVESQRVSRVVGASLVKAVVVGGCRVKSG